MSRDKFAKTTNVSRETMARLDAYAEILAKWNKAINLVSPSTIPSLWSRHFLDSAQIFQFAPDECKTWTDFGSGAGFPGLVIACLALEKNPDMQLTCIESDQRKSVFLKTIIRELDLNASVITDRIENVPSLGAGVVSARALSSLDTLLTIGKQHLHAGGRAIFLKGAGYLQEVELAQQNWTFDIQVEPSKTDQDGVILVIGNIQHG